MREKRYTIAEIREYLAGCILLKAKSKQSRVGSDDLPHNIALKLALRLLEDQHDGIGAVILRRKQQARKS